MKVLKYIKKEFCKCLQKILSFFSQNFSDKDDEFTGISLQTIIFGEAFVNEDKEYCCNGEFNLLKKFNLLPLSRKFSENKFNIYFRESSKMDISNPEVKNCKKNFVEKHKISALPYLFSPVKLRDYVGKNMQGIFKRQSDFWENVRHRNLE